MARFISNLIAWGILFLSLGTLGQITLDLARRAGLAHQSGLIQILKINRTLGISRNVTRISLRF
jgi:hypothetical protein